MRLSAILFLLLIIMVFLIPYAESSIISISQVSIDPTGYEDSSTAEWRGSFWVITALVDTTESYLLFNASGAYTEASGHTFDQNKSSNKEIGVQSTVKITITPRQPYWEISLSPYSYVVYPKTYGTKFNTVNRNAVFTDARISNTYVPELNVTVLEPVVPYQCNLYTPIDIKVEKSGNGSFTQTAHIDSLGGTETIVISNPSDSSEKVMIQDLGKLYSGISTPSLDDMLIINNSLAFQKSSVIDLIKYGVDSTGLRLVDDCYAFYWFGGGNYTVNDGGPCLVERWEDDHSPNHLYFKPLAGQLGTNCIVGDVSFPGSYRGPDEGPLIWPPLSYNQFAYPIPASILQDNPDTNPSPGRSLVSYLNWKSPSSILDLNYLQQGWTITSGNKLRIYAPTGSASSMITMKISSELADSIVYQPITAYGKCEQAYWNSTKTTSCTVTESDSAILKIKQFGSKSSKITVKPSVSSDIPISISPVMDSAILDPDSVHDFSFQVRNLGSETEQDTSVTFTIKNDLGTVTDTQTLQLKLMPHAAPTRQASVADGYPLWIWLVVVAAIAFSTFAGYLYYRSNSSSKKNPPLPPPPSEPASPLQTNVKRTPKIRFRKRILAACFMLVLIAGLGVYYYDAYHKLGFSVVGVGLGDVSYTSAEIRLTIEISNPNLLPVFVPGGDFDIYLNNQHLAYGNFGSLFLAGGSRGRITVPVTFSAIDVPFLVYGVVTGGGKVTVRLEGAAHVLLFDIPFTTTLADATIA